MPERPLSAGCEMTGHVKAGVFYVDNKRQLAQRIGTLPDGPAILRIEPATAGRTLEDNRRYHAILGEIRDHLTLVQKKKITHDDLHSYYKTKFNQDRSTAMLSERKFRTYVDMVMADAAQEWGVEFPAPEALR